jgi:hypothetical protein
MNSSTSVSSRRPVIRFWGDLVLLLLFLFLFDRALFFVATKAQNFVQSAVQLDRKFGSVKDPENRKLLIMGTSRTYEAIHPVYLSPALGMGVYKEAYIGKGPAYNYYFYQHYRRSIGIPRIAIYGVDYFIFTLHSRAQLMRIFPEAAENRQPYKRGWSLLLSNKRQLDEFVNDSLTNIDERLGGRHLSVYDPLPTQMDRYHGSHSEGDLPLTASASYKRVAYTPYPGEEGKYLDALLECLQRDHVRVFLVILPEFIGTYLTNFERDKFLAELKQLSAGFDNVQILNYNSPARFPLKKPRYFIDGGYGNMNSHLSINGSRLFSHMLIDDLKRILAAHPSSAH